MTRHEIEVIVNQHLPPYMNRLGLGDWGCTVLLVDTEEAFLSFAAADIHVEPQYKQSEMRFCVPKILHQTGLLRLLRHELLHIVLSDVNEYGGFMDLLCQNEREEKLADEIWHNSIEKAVWNIEWILDNTFNWKWELEVIEQDTS